MITLKNNPKSASKEQLAELMNNDDTITYDDKGRKFRFIRTKPNRSQRRGYKIRKGYIAPPKSKHQFYTKGNRVNVWPS